MRFDWQIRPLGDLCSIKNGYAFKSADFTDKGVPVIKIKNVKPNRILLDEISYVPEAIADAKNKWQIRKIKYPIRIYLLC